MQTEAVIFDFDGLLVDTESTALASWQHSWREHGLELDLATFFVDHGGETATERYRLLAEAVGPSFDLDATNARRQAFRSALHETIGLRDGIDAWLAEARQAGLRCAVASSSPASWVTPLLTRIGRIDAFEVLAFGDEVAQPKPAPDVYLLALDRLNVAPERAVAVEDTPHGVAAAQAARLRCIAIPNPHADVFRFGAAELLLGSATEIPLTKALAQLRPRRA